MSDSTPLQKMIDTIWAAPDCRLGPKETLAEAMEFCAKEYGLIDRLTPGCVVLKHNDPKTPGELKVRLATAGVVLVLVFFQEAPTVKMAIEVPIEKWRPGMEKTIGPQALPGVVQMLLAKAAEGLKKKKTPPPKKEIIVP